MHFKNLVALLFELIIRGRSLNSSSANILCILNMKTFSSFLFRNLPDIFLEQPVLLAGTIISREYWYRTRHVRPDQAKSCTDHNTWVPPREGDFRKRPVLEGPTEETEPLRSFGFRKQRVDLRKRRDTWKDFGKNLEGRVGRTRAVLW